ncbi:MAG: coproporphyrinogen dehydrogenase HemZ [Firmicutes bacterium]|nr:coproporphyrinogen dehydrogenase HemZ [Bacillota bacterium]
MASYFLSCNWPGNQKNMENMVTAFDPEAVFCPANQADYRIMLNLSSDERGIHCRGELKGRAEAEISFRDAEIINPLYSSEHFQQRRKEVVRRGVLALLKQSRDLELPWGILTGVRPTKIYHYLRDLGFYSREIREKLETLYLLAPDKAALLVEVGENQRPWLEAAEEQLCIYIGIPFCPTKCRYCSFASYPLSTHAHLVKGFLAALMYELEVIGQALSQVDRPVVALYIGGGTPTVLNHQQLSTLLRQIDQQLPMADLQEFTVEAGRPDTLDREKLSILRDNGVTRISVNPQTTNPQTLQLIGRQHTLADLDRAVKLVREVKIPCLNMDMIIGLPGESEQDWENTLKRLLSAEAENITLHTLAPKRAAVWDYSQIKQEINAEQVSLSLERIYAQLRIKGYHPYYLYRQRRSVAGQENTGYTLNGWEGIYNILMMEERTTIIGLGGGAISKWFNPETHTLSRTPNPKCPATYQQRIKEIVGEKVNKLFRSLN